LSVAMLRKIFAGFVIVIGLEMLRRTFFGASDA
jgi:hypothetical protein